MSYHTQMEAAKLGVITPEMEQIAQKEQMDVNLLRERVAKGSIAIPANVNHKSISPCCLLYTSMPMLNVMRILRSTW